MAIYELIVQGSYFNQVTVNKFQFEMTGQPAAVTGAFALTSAAGFIYDPLLDIEGDGYPDTGLIKPIMPAVSNNWSLQQVIVNNIYDLADFYQTTFVHPFVGGANGNDGSPALAYGFRSTRTTRAVGRATKRFAGVMEEGMADGGLLTQEYLDILTLQAQRMGQTLVYDDEGNTISFAPVVLGKQRYNSATGLPDQNGNSYRYYPTLAEQLNGHIARSILWEVYPQVRTQRSRQY